MIVFLRSLCVLSCIISGFYCLVIFRNFKKLPNVTWFGFFCFTLAIFANFNLFVNPSLLEAARKESDFNDNFFLMFFAFSTTIMNIYVHHMAGRRKQDIHRLFIFISAFFCFVAMFTPPRFDMYVYYIILIINLLTCLISFIQTLLFARERSRAFIYLSLSLLLMTISHTTELIFRLLHTGFLNPLLFTIPIYMLLQILRYSSLYRDSIVITQNLSVSISDTIKKINHSSDALMCTQMKADFLYDTLDFIREECDEDPFTAEDLTISLSKYLRHTLNFQQLKGAVPLSNEIELTKAYVSIEKEKNKNLVFEFNFPDPLPEFHIPPMSIQPLVENAIEHGFKGLDKAGRITVSLIPYRNYYQIDVSDNGVGMSEELADSLTAELHETARIGVYNIHTRLKNLFGKGLVIQSAPGVGTSVSFVVPFELEESARGGAV